MENKDSYTPEEVIQIADAYYEMKKASEEIMAGKRSLNDNIQLGFLTDNFIPNFERDVPENVREQLANTDMGILISEFKK